MEAIQLNSTVGHHRYMCQAIDVNPDPPLVGETTTLTLALKNVGPEAVTVKHIQFMIAAFGMGVAWEKLPLIDSMVLPSSPTHVERVSVQWTPTVGGHRCVRVEIEVAHLPSPLHIGRNLTVLNSSADRRQWHMPFRLGNPADRRMPIALERSETLPQGVVAAILVNGLPVAKGQPVWLNAREEVDALMVLHARTEDELAVIETVEAFSEGRLIDGIRIELYRPAYLRRDPQSVLSRSAYFVNGREALVKDGVGALLS